VTGHIDGDGQLEPEHVARIEVGQSDQEAGGAAAVGQLVQHGSKTSACMVEKIRLISNDLLNIL